MVGWECFSKFRWTLNNPNIFMFDIVHGGTICGHIAHEFLFMSIQPVFLGRSTLMQMEYPLAVLFVFALCVFFD